MHFSQFELTMNDTCDGMNFTHLNLLILLHYQSRNSENVILQWDITKENSIKRIVYASSKWTRRL